MKEDKCEIERTMCSTRNGRAIPKNVSSVRLVRDACDTGVILGHVLHIRRIVVMTGSEEEVEEVMR